MNKNKTALLIIGVFIALLFLSNLGTKIKSGDIKDYTNKITVAKYEEMIKENKIQIFYIASTSCGYCTKFAPTLIEVIDEYDLDVNYINIVEETSEGIAKIEASSEKLKGFGTPTLAVSKNGQIVDTNVGATDKNTLIEFLIENKIIDEKKVDNDDIESFTKKVTVDDYLTMKKENKVNIFYIGSTSCGYCEKFKPVLIDVIKEYNLDVNYINIIDETQAKIGELEKSSDKLTKFGTPTMAITLNDEVTYVNIGYVEKDKLVKFLKDSKIIE